MGVKLNNKDDTWEQIIQFVEDDRWGFWLSEYTRETDLVKDLRLEGDDAYEFMRLFIEKFDIDNVSEFKFNEYFEPEGDWILPMIINFILGRKKKEKKKITLGDLEKGVKEGKLI